jgi:DNA-binding response OmpR family regulator
VKTILIVEDEEVLLDIVGTVFRDAGYGVMKASSAEEALRLSASIPADLIISDVRMGEMDGFTLLERLRATDTLKNIPFIFLTAYDERDGLQRGLSLGAKAYITKPFDIDDLLERVMKLVPPT